MTTDSVRATLCPRLLAAVLAMFQAAPPASRVVYREAGGNLQQGCSAVTASTSSAAGIMYSAAFVTNDAGNAWSLASMKASQAGDATFPGAADLPCLSTTVLTNTKTGVKRAQLTPANTAFLKPGGGCSTTNSVLVLVVDADHDTDRW